MNIASMKTDEARAKGVWLPYDGAEFLVAYAESTAYKRAVNKARLKRSPAEIRRKPELLEQIAAEAMAEAVLLDWRGVKNGEEDFPCTPANKLTLLAIPEFRDWLATQCNDANNFKSEAIASDAADLKSGG